MSLSSSVQSKIYRFLVRLHSSYISKMQSPLHDPHSKVHLVKHAKSLHLARQHLKDGAVIALPTDTVYGLACDANNERAIQQLYSIKGRDWCKPVAICVKDLAAFRRYGKANHLSDALLASLLPGPITIVIERTPHLSNRFLNPHTSLIGIRIPDFAFINELCALFDEQPLALTSANRSAERSSLHVQEFQSLWPQLAAVFDAGQLGLTEECRLASTVIDLSAPNYYKVLRPGIALKSTLDVLHKFGLSAVARF